MASTKAAPPRFKVFITVDTGQTFPLDGSRSTAEAQSFASTCVLSGWWHGGLWYPPHRLTSIRTEKLLNVEALA